VASDVTEVWQLGNGPFQLIQAQVKRIVVNLLARLLKSLKQQVDLAEVSLYISIIGKVQGRLELYVPTAKLDDHGTAGDLCCHVLCILLQHSDLLVGEVILVQIGDLTTTS
jgi:hypothetical protein